MARSDKLPKTKHVLDVPNAGLRKNMFPNMVWDLFLDYLRFPGAAKIRLGSGSRGHV